MDYIKSYLINKRIDRAKIMLFENGYLDRVFAVNNRNRITENSIYGYYKIYNKPVYTEKEKEEEPYMFLTYKEEKNSSQVSIRNSIRKWHFGKRSISELDKWQFLECICSLSKIIFNDSHSLLNATNVKLEIGRTLKLSADLGLRVYDKQLKVGVVNSTTLEEANNEFFNWIRQRSRWIKGYMQTYLVHMRNPARLVRRVGWKGFFGFNFFIGGTSFTFLLYPVLLAFFGLYL